MPNSTAYGFIDVEHLFKERLTDNVVPLIQTAIRDSYEYHNETLQLMLSGLVERVTQHQWKYAIPGNKRLQPLDERGNPRPTKTLGSYKVALPLKAAGDAWGDDYVSRAKMTVEQANAFTLDAMTADAQWLKDHLLAAWLTNAAYDFDDPQYDVLTVLPMANGDSVKYTKATGTTATANHYLAQAAAISDSANPFPAIKALLSSYPGNNGPYVAYIPSNLAAAVRSLASFAPVRDPAIMYGSQMTANAAVDQDITGRNAPLARFGDELLGYVDGVWVAEWSSAPGSDAAGHILFEATNGAGAAFGMREHEEPELQGLIPQFHSPDGNHREYRYIRHAGFGALNRIRAGVYQIGSATYSIPTGYNAAAMA